METSIDIADDLLRRDRAVSRKESVALKTLAEAGLRLALDQRGVAKPVQIRPFVVKGSGNPSDLSWSHLRENLYGDEGRGLRR